MRKANTSRESVATRRLLDAAGNPPTIEAAVHKLVCKLLEGIPVAPTQLEGLQKPLDISEFCGEDVPFSGELRRSGKRFKVVYSIHLSETRRRFTIAHELGHALLRKVGIQRKQSGPEIERLCDLIAAEILMPRDLFLERLGLDPSLTHILEARNIFRVSLAAIGVRCFQLQRVSIFEIKSDEVRWASGRIRKGPFHNLDNGLLINIQAALQDPRGNMDVFFTEGRRTHKGELEWTRMSSDRTLFLLKKNHVKSVASSG